VSIINGAPTHGVRVEVFSPQLVDTFFTEVNGKATWDPPPGTAHPALVYQSEWATTWDPTSKGIFQSFGFNTDLMNWWTPAIQSQLWDTRVSANATLPLSGIVHHYDPLDFIRWINDVTWTSEWPKYRMVTAAGDDLPRPARPRRRRVV
jgi:hypothetical protein